MFRRFAATVLLLATAVMFTAVGFLLGTNVFSLRAETGTSFVALDGADQVIDRTQNQEPLIAQLTPVEQTLAQVYSTVSPSVVSISVFSNFGPGSGSGFVLDKDGNIATNFHVVEGATDIVVNFLDGTIARGSVVGLDPDSDLAVVRVCDVPVERLFPVRFGSSDNLVIGQTVVAIGSPFGQRWTMTAGIVSALSRVIDGLNQGYSIGGVIQTDAPINPGNSGGPLLNLRGEVVGMNAQIRTETGANSGIGFAIPSDLVARITAELIANGEVSYSYIGISGVSVSLDLMEDAGLPNNTRGVVVAEVLPGSPAANSGLRGGRRLESGNVDLQEADIILAANGRELQGMNDLIAFLARETRPGDTITLRVLRDGQEIDIPLTLSARP